MSVNGNMSVNDDKTKNYSVTAGREDGGNSVSATAFVSGYRDTPDPTKLNAPPYNVAGVSLNAAHENGHAVGLKAQHIPTFGNQVTASSNVNVIKIDNHRFDVNAHSTANFPKNSPNFMTHGAGAEYMFKEKVGANASVSHTPMFKQTDYSVGGSLNLHKTPTSSLDFNVGANKTVTPFHNGNWNKGGGFIFTKKF
ncbi:unnamed protein product, partial [Brenthis ino]